MHWTSYLAYRRVHADAQIIGDLGCVNCAYNLRGLRTTGSCPECGHAIAESLFVLARPQLVAEAFRSISNSYLTFLILIVGCMNLMTGWSVLVTAVVLGCGSMYRVWRAGELRYRADLGNSESLLKRARWLWWAALMEMCCAIGWVSVILFVWNTPTLQTNLGSRFILQCGMAWLLTSLFTALFAGQLGHALAGILGYGWLVVELRIQYWVTLAAMVCVPASLLMLYAPLTTIAAIMLACVLGALFMIAASFTWVSLHHVANAAEESNEMLDDVLDR